MSIFGSHLSRQNELELTKMLRVRKSDGSNLFYASRPDNDIILNAGENQIIGNLDVSDRMLKINSNATGGDCGLIFDYLTPQGTGYVGGLVRESSSGQYALFDRAQMTSQDDINFSTANFADLNSGKIYTTSAVITDVSGTGSIEINGGNLYLNTKNSIKTNYNTGFLTVDDNGVIGTETLSGLDIPLNSNLVAVGNSSNKMSSSTALEIQNGKIGIGVYPSVPTSALQVIGGINTDSISGVGQNFTNSTLSNLNTSTITGVSAFFSSISGANIFSNSGNIPTLTVSSLSGNSSFFSNITGSNISASTQISAPVISGNSITGASGSFSTLTGTTINTSQISGVSSFFSSIVINGSASGNNINASTQISAPVISGNSHTGSSAFFSSITGTNITSSNLSSVSITGSSAFINSITGVNGYFTNFSAGNITFPTSETITNLTTTTMTGTNIYATRTINSASNIVLNGLANNLTGAHITYYTSDSSSYPTRQDIQLAHDNTNISFDQYYDGSIWRASSSSASYAINKTGGNLIFRYAPATGANNSISTPTALLLNSVGQFQIQTNTDSSSVSTGSLIVCGGVGISKNLYCNALYLPTSGGTSSSFNYYEEYSMTITFTGIWASDISITAKIVRSGAIVVCYIPLFHGTSNSTALGFTSTSATALPTRFCPTGSHYTHAVIQANGTTATGEIFVESGGIIAVYRDITHTTSFTTGQDNGLLYTHLTWNIL